MTKEGQDNRKIYSFTIIIYSLLRLSFEIKTEFVKTNSFLSNDDELEKIARTLIASNNRKGYKVKILAFGLLKP